MIAGSDAGHTVSMSARLRGRALLCEPQASGGVRRDTANRAVRLASLPAGTPTPLPAGARAGLPQHGDVAPGRDPCDDRPVIVTRPDR